MNFKIVLLVIQIYIHCLFFYGLFSVPIHIILPTIILVQIIFVGLCGTVFYHRVVSHKNPIPEVVEKFLLCLSWIGASGSLIAWAGTHRKHHRYSDSAKDPHCPISHGKLKAYWYSSGNEDIIRYVPDLLRKSYFLWQHKYYFQILILFHIIIFTMSTFTVYWIVCIVPGFLMWFAGSCVNIFCHDKNGPINSNFFGILNAGEGWHKNHHDGASSSNFNHPADWGYLIYKLIK